MIEQTDFLKKYLSNFGRFSLKQKLRFFSSKKVFWKKLFWILKMRSTSLIDGSELLHSLLQKREYERVLPSICKREREKEPLRVEK